MRRMDIYKDWFLNVVMQVGQRTTFVVTQSEDVGLKYRDDPPPLAVSKISPFLDTADASSRGVLHPASLASMVDFIHLGGPRDCNSRYKPLHRTALRKVEVNAKKSQLVQLRISHALVATPSTYPSVRKYLVNLVGLEHRIRIITDTGQGLILSLCRPLTVKTGKSMF